MAIVYLQLRPEGAAFPNTVFPRFNRFAGTNFPLTLLAYDSATNQSAFWRFVSTSYGSGNLTLDLHWCADTATSGAVKWSTAIGCILPNTDTTDATTKALATTQTVTTTHLGTTARRIHKSTITISNLDSIATGDFAILQVQRLGSDAADTMAGDAWLTGMALSYSDT